MASKEDIQSKQSHKSARQNDGLGEAAKVVQDAAERLIEFTRETAEDANGEMKDKARLAEDAIASGIKSTESLIKKYPLQSALVCFGLGAFAGILLAKGRD